MQKFIRYAICKNVYGETVVVITDQKHGYARVYNVVEQMSQFTPLESLADTGETYDYQTSKFKTFYANCLLPSGLPSHTYKHDVVDFILNNCKENLKHIFDLDFMWPNFEVFGETDFLWVWPNSSARMKGKAGRTKMKPGKVFRALLRDDVSDVEVERLVDLFKETFKKDSYTFHQGKDVESFLHAYTSERGQDRNFPTSSDYKRICDSCMRYDKDHFDTHAHPVEAYASGDWGIFWVEDNQGRVCARVTYYDKPKSKELGPIYATNEQAIEFLKSNLPDECSAVCSGDWDGARLVKIEEEEGVFIAPYLDMHSNVREEMEYLVLDHCGGIEHCHEGRYRSLGEFCQWCEEYTQNGVIYIESVDRCVCQSCLDHDFFTSDLSGEVFSDSHLVVVYDDGRSRYWSEDEAENDAFLCEVSGEYYTERSVWETLDGFISRKYIEDGSYVVCSVDNLAYPKEEMVETKLGPVQKYNYEKEEVA